MPDLLRRHRYALNRILIPAARILSPEFNAVYIFLTGSHVEILRNLLDYANRQSTFVDEYHDEYYLSPSAGDWDSIQAIVAELEYMLMTVVLGYYDAYVCVRDKKANGVPGGSFTQDAWRTRDLNDELADPAGIASLSGNQITLATGTYRCAVICPAYRTNDSQARLYNISDSVELVLGGSVMVANSAPNTCYSFVLGRFTLPAAKILEVQHYGTRTQISNGFGVAGWITDEVYTVAEFWRET